MVNKMDLRDLKEFLKDTSKYIIVIVVVFLVIMYVVSFQQVIGPSMEPTLKEGSFIAVNKFSYRFREIRRNEIIIFKHDEKYLIKRIIGLPGETIEYKDNVLYINSEPYDELFLENSITEDYNTGKIPENKYFVLGDNRENSLDGNDFGLIDEKDIIGKAWFVIWPFNQIKGI